MLTEGVVQEAHPALRHERKPPPGSHSLTPPSDSPQSTLFYKAKLFLMVSGRKEKPSCQKVSAGEYHIWCLDE